MPIRRIFADIAPLFDGAATLVLDADATAGVSTLTVKSILGVGTNKILFIRTPGSESAEIIATHASTAPSGNTVTLASALVESHPAGTTIFVIPFNTIRFYHSATEVDANADASSLSALAAAQNIDGTLPRNYYDDTVETSGFYYWRFINSITSVNDNYSDAIPWGQQEVEFEDDEVGFVLEFVRRKLAQEWNERFSKSMAIDEINACIRYVQGRLKKWSKYFTADYVLGQTARGVFEFTLPDAVFDKDSNRSIVQLRLGTATDPLIPKSEREMDQIMADVVQTTVRTQPIVGATSLNIVNSYDLDDAGTVHVYTNGTLNAITYTGVTRSATAGVLTGIPASGTGSITATHAVGTNVWQNEVESQPLYFNVREGTVRTYPLAGETWQNKNVLLDFSSVATRVDSESDKLDIHRYDMVKHWLLWQGKAYWRHNGVPESDDIDFKLFTDMVKTAVRTEVGQKTKMSPKLNTIAYRSTPRGGSFETE